MNTLYPIFLKPCNLKLLIIGGGNVAEEKLRFILKNSPDMNIKLVASSICEEVNNIAKSYNNKIEIKHKRFDTTDLLGINLIIAATNNYKTNLEIVKSAKSKNILINVADTPELCDFYLGSIVTKGDLKIAISTNGKSPTLAKRLREIFAENIPNNTNELINNLNQVRNILSNDFSEKVEKLNELTSSLLAKNR